jgi:hypothetical protein
MALHEPIPSQRSVAVRRNGPSPVVIAQVLAVTVFFALATLRFMVAPIDRHDEGVTLTNAALSAGGLVPFRDYWATYGPLDTYVLAAAFKLFAVNVMVERALGVAVLALLAVVAYAVTGRLGLRGGIRLLLTGLISVVPISVPAFNSAFLANVIGLSALLAFLSIAWTGSGADGHCSPEPWSGWHRSPAPNSPLRSGPGWEPATWRWD